MPKLLLIVGFLALAIIGEDEAAVRVPEFDALDLEQQPPIRIRVVESPDDDFLGRGCGVIFPIMSVRFGAWRRLA